jgi:hypothetical protein
MAPQLDAIKQKAKSITRKVLWALLALLIVGSTVYYFARTYTISEGSRTGLLYKISKKGYVFKTFEGELHTGNSMMMNEQSIWKFSAKDAAVYESLQKNEGKNVTLHYRQLQNAFPWQGDTDYLVYKVE